MARSSPVPFQDEHFNLGDASVRTAFFSIYDGFLCNLCITVAAAAATGSDPSSIIAVGFVSVVALGVKSAASFWVAEVMKQQRDREEINREESHLQRYPEEEQLHLMEVLTQEVCRFSPATRDKIKRDFERHTGDRGREVILRMHAALELGLDLERVDEDPTRDAVGIGFWAAAGALLPTLPWVFFAAQRTAAVGVGVLALALCFVNSAFISQWKLNDPAELVGRQVASSALCTGMSYGAGLLVHYLMTHTISIDVRSGLQSSVF